MLYCSMASTRWLQLPNNNCQQGAKIALVINPPYNLVVRELCDRRHATRQLDVWCVYAPGHQGLKSRTNSILLDGPRLRLYRPIGAPGAEQMVRSSVSPGGLVTAALQQEMLILADRLKTALVPYSSEGWGPVWNREELILTPYWWSIHSQ